MPSFGRWAWIGLLLASPLACAATPVPSPQPPAVTAPPSAALLEFIGDWNVEERELLTMDDKTEQRQPTPASSTPGGRSAP